MIMAILALSLALVWGYGGILCFGQSAFFGLGAYTYAIAMFNIGESTVPLLLAIALPAAFAALLGYFMFYGRISDVYLGVITLTVTLILFNSINSTAGPEFHIGVGAARRLQRHSGNTAAQRPRRRQFAGSISKACSISRRRRCWRPISDCGCCWRAVSAGSSSASGRTSGAPNYWATIPAPTSLRPSPSAARWPVSPAACSRIGETLSARPSSASPQSAQIIIWVIVGGRGTLIGPIVGCIGIQWLSAALGANQPSGARTGGPKLAQQCAADPRRHPDRLRAAGAEGTGADARRYGAVAAAFARDSATAVGHLRPKPAEKA